MKTIITLIFILFIGVSAQAQDDTKEVKEVTVEVTVKAVKENNVARLYKYKNSKITKALSFRTKRNKAKLA